MTQPDDTKKVEYRGTGFYVSLIVAGIVVLALIVLTLQNTDSVTFEFLGWDIDLPLFGLILITVLLTVAIDELVGLAWRRRRRRQLTEREELKELRRRQSDSPESQDETPTPPDEQPPVVRPDED